MGLKLLALPLVVLGVLTVLSMSGLGSLDATVVYYDTNSFGEDHKIYFVVIDGDEGWTCR